MTVTLVIDDRSITVEGRHTVLEAARKLGVYIPTFCHHARLSPLGACRMCLVEVEGMGKLQTACTLPAAEGMRVWTATPRVEAARREMLEFLLINHALECPVCEASGECTLQDFTFKYGAEQKRFAEQRRVLRDHIISPLIDRNLNRCIQCKRCVRVCEEVQGVTALGMSFRGAGTVVGPFMEKSLDCEFCGHCIWVCPVGAITSRVMRHRIRGWEMEKVSALCPYCADGCVLTYNCRDNLVLKVTHAEGKGVNSGSLCSRGFFGFDLIGSRKRLTTPLVRKEGVLTPATWEEAIAAASSGFARAREEKGPAATGGIAGERLTNEELYLFQKLFRAQLGSDNLDTTGGAWRRAVLPFLRQRLGVAGGTNSLEELAGCDALLLVGCEVTVAAPITGLLVKKAIRAGAAVTELSFRRTPLSRLARRTLRVPPGRELAVVKAMTAVILEEGLYPAGEISTFEGRSRLSSAVEEMSPARAAEEAGVPLPDLVEAATEFARGPRSSILFGEQAALGPRGPELLDALADLLLLTGRAGWEGCGLYPVGGGANGQGATDMGAGAGLLPGHAPLSDPGARERLERLWGAPLPESPGLDAPGMMEAARSGALSALLVAGADPVSTHPGPALGPGSVAHALGRLSHLVVVDLFLTPTAELASVVLPACSLAARSGTLTNSERRVQWTAKAVEPGGQALPDWRILSALSSALGSPSRFAEPGEVLEEIARAVPAYSGISPRLLGDRGLLWPFTAADARELYHEGYFGTRHLLPQGPAEGKRAFSVPAGWGEPVAAEGFPLTLVTGDLLFHSGVFTRWSDSLQALASSAVLLAHPQTLYQAGVEGGGRARVRVTTPAGEVWAEAAPSEDLLPGVLFLPRHFTDPAAARLMPGGKMAGRVTTPARIEPAPNGSGQGG